MTVLILGGTDDENAAFMMEHLRGQGTDTELIDSRWFPRELRLSHDPVCGRWSLILPGGRQLSEADISSVYWRCYNGVAGTSLPDAEQSYIAGNDARSLFESWLIAFPTRWVNGWSAFRMHQTKPVQLAAIARLGVTAPATILTNDPKEVREFAERYPRCIFKPVQGGAHTRVLSPAHLGDTHLANLAFAPVTLQEEIVGTNIRAFVAGQRVLACEVEAETLDFRDTDDPRIVPHALPTEIETQCRRIAETLHLLWTGIDFRLTPDGRYVFLEANPSPMFMGFQSRCGLPLTEALADLLTGK